MSKTIPEQRQVLLAFSRLWCLRMNRQPRPEWQKKHTWSIKINRFVMKTVKHPVKVHVCWCFYSKSFGVSHLFTNNLNAQKMIKICQNVRTKSSQRWFGSITEHECFENNGSKYRHVCVQTRKWHHHYELALPFARRQSDWKSMVNNDEETEGKICTIWSSWGDIYGKLGGLFLWNCLKILPKNMPVSCQTILGNKGD